MKYALLDEKGYLRGLSECPFSIDGDRAAMMEIPDGIDGENLDCYRLVGGGFVFDADRRGRKIIEEMARERDLKMRAEADELIRRKAAAWIARNAAADDVIALSVYLPEWAPGRYAAGDAVVYDGVPYRCARAHDSSAGGWLPPEERELWTGFYATREHETARRNGNGLSCGLRPSDSGNDAPP